MPVAESSSFNNISREILGKIEVYFDGALEEPIIVTRDDYLIDFTLLEEATAGDTPFDNVSSNELSFNLYSPNSIFSPTNKNSPYYGKMQRGVLVIPYLKAAEEDEWLPLGDYYISDWSSAITSSTASVVANDIFYNIFGLPDQDTRVKLNQSITTVYEGFFKQYNITPVVDPTISSVLPVSYNILTNKDFLTKLAIATLTLCFCGHDGGIYVKNLASLHTLDATITDGNQIISMDAQMSINSDYDSAILKYAVPQIQEDVQMLSVSELQLNNGVNYINYSLSEIPLYRLLTVGVQSNETLVELDNVHATSKTISCEITNSGPDSTGTLVVTGQNITTIPMTIGLEGENTLTISNEYIQTGEQAQAYIEILNRFTAAELPILQLSIRGNPMLQIGDKIRAVSEFYGIDFTGFIMRCDYTYNGGLSCNMTLLNSDLVEVVT